ncbi:RNA polymerase sigma factor (sigma-70 family) [Allocatelliglobosispora scoriae]|uniref:RNA polymerase sigma factor (Sigma-70 family) n=1 Tax=Allocatelliglobosispora scoriae TaxID=643052 RepID=A0A841BRF9_9ACTN|nr:sigma-70 family RNA polymerase sigma factor [Allocatelliglobosispora scoriae]MBB5871637.1 RNA polymerase sigma factor (sigma-70 family) [Allocatelliglobosispora scoriae]
MLIARVREGDSEAFGELYTRHVTSARRLAHVLSGNTSDAEDLVAEAFTKVLAGLRGGGGPEQAFRAYLLTTVRHVRYDRARREKRVETTDDIESFEQAVEGEIDPTIDALERSYAARAFSKLPERWRAVLWHTEVEGESPAQVAPLLGLTANAVAALAYRARERLRQGYLAEHITLTGSPRCHWTGEHLPGYVRAGLAGRERSKVEDHLSECAECRRLHRELTEANVGLRGVLAPILLGAAAPGYLAGASAKVGIAAWFTGLTATVVGTAKTAWWWLSTLPTRLAQRYGGGNVAAAAGILLAAFLGISIFTGIAMMQPSGPRYSAQLPLPAPAQTPPVVPPPIEPQPSQPVMKPVLPPTRLTPTKSTRPTPAPTRTDPARPGPTKGPVPAAPVALRPDISAGDLVAGSPGTLPITVGGRGESTTESTTLEELVLKPAAPLKPTAALEPAAAAEPAAVSKQAAAPWTLRVSFPQGVVLAGKQAGDGWVCAAAPSGATCTRKRTTSGSTARLPIRVAAEVTGYQKIVANVDDVVREFRVPIAPAGMRVAYAGTGRLAVALAGNTLVSCADRPACLRTDNNLLPMSPLLPTVGEPDAPAGLAKVAAPAGPKAVSGAQLDLPKGAKVRWAGLTLVTGGRTAPDLVVLHGPSGEWQPQRLKVTKGSGPRASMNGFADVTALLRRGEGGNWWVAAAAKQLPKGAAAYAGWTLAVAYELPGAPVVEVAVHLGQVALQGKTPLSVRVPADHQTSVGYAIFDGDRNLLGDTLSLGSRVVGEPGNLANGTSTSANALLCAAITGTCPWRTPGLDIDSHAGVVDSTGVISLKAGDDPFVLGLLAVSTRIGTVEAPSGRIG